MSEPILYATLHALARYRERFGKDATESQLVARASEARPATRGERQPLGLRPGWSARAEDATGALFLLAPREGGAAGLVVITVLALAGDPRRAAHDRRNKWRRMRMRGYGRRS